MFFTLFFEKDMTNDQATLGSDVTCTRFIRIHHTKVSLT